MIIVRKEDGKEVKLNGGFFSARLNRYHSNWLPCEGEALGIKMVLEHFAPYIRESRHQTQHFTASMPCVHAFRRAKKGAFSSSVRIATFLTSISGLNVDIIHTAGKKLTLVDYISRHPVTCKEEKCQICKFTKDQVAVGDNAASIKSSSSSDSIYTSLYKSKNSFHLS